MQVEIKIDPSMTEPKIIVQTASMTDELNDLLRRLSEPEPRFIAGFREGDARLLDRSGILRIYASGGKVLAQTEEGEFSLRQRLYELEPRLRGESFVIDGDIQQDGIFSVPRLWCFPVPDRIPAFIQFDPDPVIHQNAEESLEFVIVKVIQHSSELPALVAHLYVVEVAFSFKLQLTFLL